MLIDTHAHLDMQAFDKDRREVLDRAWEGGITQIVTVGIDLQSSLRALELARGHDFIFATVGCHPHEAQALKPQDLQRMEALASEPKIVGWGEVGLDLYHRHSAPDIQVAVFRDQVERALRLDLPLIIHDREAHQEVLATLSNIRPGGYRGVLHCFSGDYDLAMTFIEMGFHISIPGPVTYKNAHETREVAARIPLDRLLLETDAPYLAPVPRRGKRNEPLFVTYTAQRIAELRDMDFEELCRRTSANARELFGLPAKGR